MSQIWPCLLSLLLLRHKPPSFLALLTEPASLLTGALCSCLAPWCLFSTQQHTWIAPCLTPLLKTCESLSIMLVTKAKVFPYRSSPWPPLQYLPATHPLVSNSKPTVLPWTRQIHCCLRAFALSALPPGVHFPYLSPSPHLGLRSSGKSSQLLCYK